MVSFNDSVEDLAVIEAIREYVKSHRIKLVMFDLFETIVFPKCLDEKSCKNELNPKNNNIFKPFFRVLRSLIVRIHGHELSKSRLGNWVWKLESKYFQHSTGHYFPRQLIVNLVKELSASSTTVAIVSNTMISDLEVLRILQSCGLAENQFFTSKSIGVLKSQGLYQQVLEQLGCNSDESLIVGDDRKEDLQPGSQIRVKAFLVEKISKRLNPVLNTKQIVQLNGSELGRIYLLKFAEILSHQPLTTYGMASGFFYSGLLANTTAKDLLEISKNNGASNIIFLSREGYLVKAATKKHLEGIESTLTCNYLYASRALIRSSSGLEFVKKQISEMNLNGHSLVFDVGWRGYFLGEISGLITQKPTMVMIGIWPWIVNQKNFKTTIFRRRNLLRAWTFRKCPEIVEFLLAAPHETVQSEHIKPIAKDSWESAILDGADLSPTYTKNSELEKFLTLKLFQSLLSRPSKPQAVLFNNIFHSANGEPSMRLTHVAKDGRIFWLQGSKAIGNSSRLARFREVKRRFKAGLSR
jgi:FMN phosphatase YigB (HAD superfamily)